MGDIISAISIMVGVLSYFFGVAYTDMQKLLIKVIPPKEQKAALEKQCKEITAVIFQKIVPISIGFLLLWYICLPMAIDIINSSTFSVWGFDILNTLFLGVESIITVFIVLLVILLCKAKRKIHEMGAG